MTTLADLLTRHGTRQDALLPLLHDIQREWGYVSEEHMRGLAAALNLSRAEVYGVASFYHDFTLAPDPRPVVEICRAEACQARGIEAIVASIAAKAATDDSVRLRTVYCLGLCSAGPAARLGDTLYARLDDETLSALISAP